MSKSTHKNSRFLFRIAVIHFAIWGAFCVACSLAGFSAPQGPKTEKKDKQPAKDQLVLNGDKIEYVTGKKDMVVTGNVEVDYKGTMLKCDTLTMNSQTKDCVADGHVRLDDTQGVIEGQRMTYNFETGSGIMRDASFRAEPYLGTGRRIERFGEGYFSTTRGHVSTCGFDRPHYRIGSQKVTVFPKDKIQTKDDTFYVGDFPLFCLPEYTHSLKEPLMHVQVLPGNSKDWGQYLLTAWRYNITDYINGRIYLDYRAQKGVAEGAGANYTTRGFGKGDVKIYYMQERDHKLTKALANPRVFERYFARLRHKWDIDEATKLTMEIYKITDSKRFVQGFQYNVLKDYFEREYEKNMQPETYALINHSFKYASLDLFIKQRTNRWYDPGYLESLPELRFSLPSIRLWNALPVLYDNYTTLGNYNKKNTSTSTPAANDTNPDVHYNRIDTTSRVSFPWKVMFIQFAPFVSDQTTYYNEGVDARSIAPRTIFSSGASLSTKFYRVFNVKRNFLGLDINGLRHIITPTVDYSYSHRPTLAPNKIRQIDGVDAIKYGAQWASLGLSNKLQTKRGGSTVDLLDLNVTNTYTLQSRDGTAQKGHLADFNYKMTFLPYSWLSIVCDGVFTNSGSRENANYHTFSNANTDINFNFGQDRKLSLSQRYQRKGSNQYTYSFDWRLNPKWKFRWYYRHERGHGPNLNRGLKEQEFSIIRDLHCWDMELTYNGKKGHGSNIWLIFRLKAFPEMEFNYNQSYHQPKPGHERNY